MSLSVVSFGGSLLSVLAEVLALSDAFGLLATSIFIFSLKGSEICFSAIFGSSSVAGGPSLAGLADAAR